MTNEASARAKLGERQAEFSERYGRKRTKAEQAVERDVFGDVLGITSYMTKPQADLLADALHLRPDARLLDVGAGAGWPGLYLAEKMGCLVVLTDVPPTALRQAKDRAKLEVAARSSFAVASGGHLPFRSRSFDAVVHSDVL